MVVGSDKFRQGSSNMGGGFGANVSLLISLLAVYLLAEDLGRCTQQRSTRDKGGGVATKVMKTIMPLLITDNDYINYLQSE